MCLFFQQSHNFVYEVSNFRQLKLVVVFFFFFMAIFRTVVATQKRKKKKIQCVTTSVVQRIFLCGKNVPKSPDFEEKNPEIALFIY